MLGFRDFQLIVITGTCCTLRQWMMCWNSQNDFTWKLWGVGVISLPHFRQHNSTSYCSLEFSYALLGIRRECHLNLITDTSCTLRQYMILEILAQICLKLCSVVVANRVMPWHQFCNRAEHYAVVWSLEFSYALLEIRRGRHLNVITDTVCRLRYWLVFDILLWVLLGSCVALGSEPSSFLLRNPT